MSSDTSLSAGITDPLKKQPTAAAPSAGQGLTQPAQPLPLSGLSSPAPAPVDRAPAATAAPFTPTATPDPLAFAPRPGMTPGPVNVNPVPATPPLAAPADPFGYPTDAQNPAAPRSTATEGAWDEISGTYKNPDGSTLSGPTARGGDISAYDAATDAADRRRDAAAIAMIPGATRPEDMAYAAVHGGFSPANNPNAAPMALPGNGAGAPPAAGGPSGGRPGEAVDARPIGSGPDPITQLVDAVHGGSSGSTPTRGTPPSGGAGVGLTPTNPQDSLLGYTISPDNTVDRVKLAQGSLQSTIENVLNPQFAADQRDLNRYNFGAGRGVSGAARTSQGDLLSRRNQQIADLTNQVLTGATTGSIDDMYRNIGVKQQQQGFQRDQQNDAFSQTRAIQELADAENEQQFNQALQKLLAGSAGDPSQVALILAQIFGGNADAAARAAASYSATNGNAPKAAPPKNTTTTNEIPDN